MSVSLSHPRKTTSLKAPEQKLTISELKESHELLVSVKIQNASHTVLWKTEQPLPIGHPFRYVLEKTKEGFRLRNLRSNSTNWNKGLVQSLDFSDVVSGHGILEFDLQTPLVIRVKLPQKFVAPFYSSDKQGAELHIFSCQGEWAQTATLFQNEYKGLLRSDEIFQLTKKNSNEYWLKTKNPELKIKTKNSFHPAREGVIQFKDLLDSTLVIGEHSWHFSSVATPHFNQRTGTALPSEEDNRVLRKSLIGVFGFLFFALTITFLWPKSKEEELIPEQFTKIVMTAPTKPVVDKPKTEETAQLMEGGNTSQKPVSEKVKQTAVAQAFRTQALQNAVSGLLKGGMTSLMASKNLAQSGRSSGEIARYFNEKADAMKGSLVAGSGQGVPNASKVGMIGGASGGGKAGYAEGANAKVAGQGGNFVALDTSGSFVEEGLTKDEVGEVIHKHMSEIRYCYESTMNYTPDLEGKLLLAFTINPQGRVSTSSVKSSTVPDPRLDDCVVRRLMTWKFPNPKGGINVDVTYPFLFKTLGR